MTTLLNDPMPSVLSPSLTDIPRADDAECAVIGSVLMNPSAFATLQGYLQPRHFHLLKCRILWQAFNALSTRGDYIDMTSVKTYLEDETQQFDDIGLYAGLVSFVTLDMNSMHYETYGRQVHRAALYREMHAAGVELARASLDQTTSPRSAIQRLDRKALDLTREVSRIEPPIRTMEQAGKSKFARLIEAEERHKANPQHIMGVRTGIEDLDRLLDGLRPGVTTLAAATGMGKTGFALQITRFASERGFLRVAPSAANVHFFSGEMTEDQLMNRVLAGMTGVPIRQIERGSFNAVQKKALGEAIAHLDQNHRLTYEDGARMNTAQIRQRVRTLVMDNCLDLLVLDGLLQIETPKDDGRGYKAQRRDMIEEIMNELEDIGISYKLPILLTHQVSRAPANRENKRPQLSDLAEASFVDQKSAVVMFLYRGGYYDKQIENPNAAEIIVAKNRHGETDTIHTHYDAQHTRFVDADRVTFTLGGHS